MFQWSLLFVSSLLALAMATHTGNDWPSGSITCGNNIYTRSNVERPIPQGLVAYPRKFNNINNLTIQCLGGSLEEFPILPGRPYTTGSAGPDRVIYIRAQHEAEYCTVVTRRDGFDGNPFVLCEGS
ncbi:Ribonuclease/ribotoxin [Armillaria novae-zelandiae]|uniref:Ribonuclease/ribotoxin n=1 Tax=Armillaria novae-zelandiae TaxID=153914 RepID=A0AA39TAH4_9AGAR|nr:Ribonuclease/ribotoxin [Armillaria novae-zelandiae]